MQLTPFLFAFEAVNHVSASSTLSKSAKHCDSTSTLTCKKQTWENESWDEIGKESVVEMGVDAKNR